MFFCAVRPNVVNDRCAPFKGATNRRDWRENHDVALPAQSFFFLVQCWRTLAVDVTSLHSKLAFIFQMAAELLVH